MAFELKLECRLAYSADGLAGEAYRVYIVSASNNESRSCQSDHPSFLRVERLQLSSGDLALSCPAGVGDCQDYHLVVPLHSSSYERDPFSCRRKSVGQNSIGLSEMMNTGMIDHRLQLADPIQQLGFA